MLDNLSKNELLKLLYTYDKYIQNANEENRYSLDWYPVCIEEFYYNEFKEWVRETIQKR